MGNVKPKTGGNVKPKPSVLFFVFRGARLQSPSGGPGPRRVSFAF